LDWDDEHCRRILSAIHRAANPGARIVVVEQLMTDGPESTFTKLMDINMLVMLDGRQRTQEEFARLLDDCGFRFEQAIPAGMMHMLEASHVPAEAGAAA
jgi:hypothetical protein